MKYALGIAALIAIWIVVSPDRGRGGKTKEPPADVHSHDDEPVENNHHAPSDKEVELQNELDAVDQSIADASAQAGAVTNGRTTAQHVARLKELNALLEGLNARRNFLIEELQLEKR